jgi:hypothetical protein
MPHLPDSQHPDHDLELVAAYAAGDAAGPELERATALVSTCAECAALHHDLRAIAAAMPELPAPARRRDFRLTPEQAASLRPSGIRGLLATLSGPRFSFATPLGTGLAALGIVGVLVASGGLPSGGGTAAPQPETAIMSPADGGNAAGAGLASEAPAAEAPELAALPSAAPSAPSAASAQQLDQASPEVDTAGGDTMGGGSTGTTPAPSEDADLYLTTDASPDASRATDLAQPLAPSPVGAEASPVTSASASTTTAWAAVAALLVVAGLAMVVLRWTARRLA